MGPSRRSGNFSLLLQGHVGRDTSQRPKGEVPVANNKSPEIRNPKNFSGVWILESGAAAAPREKAHGGLVLARLIRGIAAGLTLLALTSCASVPPPGPPLPEIRLNLPAYPALIIEYPNLIVAVFCGERDAITITHPDGRRLMIFFARCTAA